MSAWAISHIRANQNQNADPVLENTARAIVTAHAATDSLVSSPRQSVQYVAGLI